MVHFYLFFFVSFGLGYFFTRGETNKLEVPVGLQCFIGFALISISILILNSILGINVDLAAYVIGAISIIGTSLYIYEHKKNLVVLLKHPFIITSFVFCLIYLLYGPSAYQAHTSDEFSHWLSMPKQIFLFKTLQSSSFPLNNFAAYTPGWPTLLLFPDIFLSDFFYEKNTLWISLFSALVSAFALSDLLFKLDIFKKMFNFWGRFIIIFILYCLSSRSYFIPTSSLIELPMAHGLTVFWGVVALIIQQHTKQQIKEMKLTSFILGITLAHAYLLKHNFITLVPIVFLLFIFLKNLNWTKKLEYFLYSISIFSLTYITWNVRCHLNGYTNGYSAKLPGTDQLTSLLSDKVEMFRAIPPRLYEMMASHQLLGFIGLTFFILFIFWKKSLHIRLIATYFLIYFLSLTWIYITVFSKYEATNLASFDRYLSVPFNSILVWGWLFFFSILPYEKIEGFLGTPKKYLLFFPLFLLALSIFMLTKYTQRIHIPSDPFKPEINRFLKYIQDQNVATPSVLLIHQGSNDGLTWSARNSSIGPEKLFFTLPVTATSYGEHVDNYWRIKKSSSEMLDFLKTFDVLWIIKSNSWLDEILKKIIVENECPPPYEQYFMHQVNGSFLCTKKGQP